MKKPTNSNVTMRDVATAAGVSVAAVSKALNNKADISNDLRKKIFDVCDELDYKVNISIQDLVRKGRNGSTKNIAFIIVRSDFADPAYSRAIDGVSQAAQKHGLHLILDRMQGDEQSIYDLPPILRDGRVDGIVLTGDITANAVSTLKKLYVPYVILGSYSNKITESCVNVQMNTEIELELMVRELKENGKKRIAYFSENPDNYYERDGLNYFKSALIENDLPVFDDLIYFGTGRFSGTTKAIEKIFLQKELPFDSIVCLNFRVAQEISHLVMAYYGIGNRPKVTIGTLRPFDYYSLSVPAVYRDMYFDQVAYEGLDILVDIIAGKRKNVTKKIMLNP